MQYNAGTPDTETIVSSSHPESNTTHLFNIHGYGDVVTRIMLNNTTNHVSTRLVLDNTAYILYHDTKTILDMPFFCSLCLNTQCFIEVVYSVPVENPTITIFSFSLTPYFQNYTNTSVGYYNKNLGKIIKWKDSKVCVEGNKSCFLCEYYFNIDM